MDGNKILILETVRDLVHNLDVTDSVNEEIFRKYTREFIIMLKGVSDKAYRDSEGKTTIDVGSNMDRGGRGAMRMKRSFLEMKYLLTKFMK